MIQPDERSNPQQNALVFSAAPSDLELTAARVFTEPLIPMTSAAVPGENSALASALQAYKDNGNEAPLVEFISAQPQSRWCASLEYILGLIAFDRGYFSKALNYWSDAWQRAKSETDIEQKAVADGAVSHLLLL